MASRPLSLARRPLGTGVVGPSVVVAAGAMITAVAISAIVAFDTKVGVELIVGLCFIAIALVRPPLAICGWTVMLFFSRTSAFQSITNRTLLFIGVCWVGLLLGRRLQVGDALARNRTIVILTFTFISWMVVSLAWAPVPSVATQQVKDLIYAGFSVVLLLGALTEPRYLRWLFAAFIIGATLSVVWGAAKGGLSVSAGGEASEVADTGGRFQGGAGDPNYLAAVLVPAIMLAGGLAARRGSGQRLLLALATVIIAIGLAATQSRGGLIAAAVCSIVALIIWRGRRLMIASFIALAASATAVFFIANPAAWQRIGESNSGSGRVDIWSVAWRIVSDHPFFGVGIAQFPEVSPHYVLQPGVLKFVGLIVEQHIVVHNLYLQLWAEDGMIGLLLFLSVVVVSLTAGWRAVKRFDLLGDIEMSALARGSILGLVGMLTASFFLSNLEAGQLWILLALGPLLAAFAQQRSLESQLAPASG